MIPQFPNTMPGQVLLVLLGTMLLVLALRLADEAAKDPRNHLMIVGGSLMAFGIVYRIADVMTYLHTPRWSAVIIASGVLAFLAADQSVAARYGRAWRLMVGKQVGRYEGPERRHGRLGTSPDKDNRGS